MRARRWLPSLLIGAAIKTCRWHEIPSDTCDTLPVLSSRDNSFAWRPFSPCKNTQLGIFAVGAPETPDVGVLQCRE